MRLDARGHPLHTRALTVTLTQRADGKLDVDGSVLDLRKRGFVPVAGELQASGVIHQMFLRGVLDPRTRILETLAAEQPTVAFEASAATGGESCRDPIARVGAVAGTTVGGDLARRLGDEIGGPRGCSHILTLGRLVASTAAWALDRDRAAFGDTPARRPGERLFRRDVTIDASEEAEGRLLFAVQLADLRIAPVPPLVPPMNAFGGHHEVQATIAVDFATRSVAAARVAERDRGPATLAGAVWQAHPEIETRLVGLPLGAGGSAELVKRLAGTAPPLLDALLMVAPTLIQCLAAMADTLPLAARASGALSGIGGLPDSCWMWRRDGALARR